MVEEHRKALVTYAEKLMSDHHLAEDIVQEALIRAWHHADRLRTQEGSVRGWLLKVTRNLVIDRVRSAYARHERVALESWDSAQPDRTDEVLASVEAVSLMRGLSREHREVLVLIHMYGRSVNEAAHILGVPAGTVKSRQHYALRRLRARHSSARPSP
ncbi:sigma-70 family RNA polymerase sigma factor [Streptomyces sp. ICN441]|uniref:sigma-70 family RNA polymerase sigma factor n=1 Tax=Streptomyces sp. ICN441 TaxID=2558286 RepID=UPI00106AC1AE|nr:sigma-70 family RNA polymerase sigma factor [Streptomyces sp. ICN441]TFE37095.1 sigma-70 family RNA polymerase sigma factor [Streptomyces sp. ICN441]